MKRTLVFTALLIAGMISLQAQGKWAADKSHSNIGFSATHMVISQVDGYFDDYEVMVSGEKENFSDAQIEFTAQIASINTGNEKRDGHLKSADFFDAEKYPEMTFKGKGLTEIGDNMYKLTGDLTLHGVTKEVTMDVKYGGTITDPYGMTRSGFRITGEINRFDFDLKWNATLETGGLVVGEDVEININLELVKQDKG